MPSANLPAKMTPSVGNGYLLTLKLAGLQKFHQAAHGECGPKLDSARSAARLSIARNNNRAQASTSLRVQTKPDNGNGATLKGTLPGTQIMI